MAYARMFSPLRRCLGRALAAWVRWRPIDPPPSPADLDPQLPTLYVLPRPALSDTLLLATLAPRLGLPAADVHHRIGEARLPACLALPAPRRRLWRGATRPPSPFLPLIEACRAEPGCDVQLIPVSIFWGRAPGKRFGVWQTLAADSWRLAGRVRRLLSVAINGRNVEVQLGAPLRLSALDDGRPVQRTERKAYRLLRMHFRRVRTRVLGPDLSHRRTLIAGVAASPEVRARIDTLAQDDARARARLERRAQRYGREIASNMAYPVMRFFDGLLRRLWNRLYDGVDVQGLASVKALAGDHTLVYVPCHRSHIDYLLLSYVLYQEGLMPPHIAAGRNLDMPLIGPLLRRGGAFFMRRSFRDNPLYATVFNEYLHRLLSRGHPLEYFIEGGRSRSGRMLPARPGMLAMTLGSFLRSQAGGGRPLVFVPVYLGYERILEGGSYAHELGGGRKAQESPLDLLRVSRRLRQPFGRVAVNIGEPLSLAAFLDQAQPGWRADVGLARPAWRDAVVPRLGETLLRRINAAAALNPANLVALGLLATPHQAIEADLLAQQLALLVALQRRRPGGDRLSLPAGSPPDWIEQVRRLGMLDYRCNPLGDIVSADPRQAARLAWYRNNVLHLFALAGLVAFAFRQRTHRTRQELTALLAPSWPVVARELTVAPPASLDAALGEMLETLAELGLLARRGDAWRRPEETLAAGEQLKMLGRLMQPTLERGYLLVATLLGAPSGHFSRDGLVDHCGRLAERLARLTGRQAPEFFDARLFAGLVEGLEREGWLRGEAERLYYDARLREAAQHSRSLYDPALRHRLERVTHRLA